MLRTEGISTLMAWKAVGWQPTTFEEGRDWHFEGLGKLQVGNLQVLRKEGISTLMAWKAAGWQPTGVRREGRAWYFEGLGKL